MNSASPENPLSTSPNGSADTGAPAVPAPPVLLPVQPAIPAVVATPPLKIPVQEIIVPCFPRNAAELRDLVNALPKEALVWAYQSGLLIRELVNARWQSGT